MELLQATENAGHLSPLGVAEVTSQELVNRGFAVTITVGEDRIGEGVLLTFANERRDWSAGKALVFTLQANGAHRLKFHFKHGNGTWTFYLIPRPGLLSRVVIPFAELQERPGNMGYSGFSRFGGGPHPVDLTAVETLSITFNQVSPATKQIVLSDMGITEDIPESAVLNPYLVVDAWGQWIGERGNPRTDEAIQSYWRDEATVPTRIPGYTKTTGADSAHKIDEGNGFFRVAQEGERWFLVDPEGYAFWSVGCDCVRAKSEGPIHDNRLYSDLTIAEKSERSRGQWHYPLWADFYQANLRRRYAELGAEWYPAWAVQTANRLQQWGFNTIANWSDGELTQKGLMPYTTNVSSLAPLCGHLPDVYAPDFADRVRDLVTPEVTPYVADPLLIGYFVGNEPHWTFGGHRHPFNDVFVSAEYPHTRTVALEWVRENYGNDIHGLNIAWKTAFHKWEDLTEPGAIPDVRLGSEALQLDADEFMGKVLTEFYRVCCQEIRAVDPNHLLLGGRFYTPMMAEPYVRACKFFDVYSFNYYNWNAPTEAIDRILMLTGRPVLIGEFHYGVEGRGLTPSLIACASEEDKGLAYRHFVENIAALPGVVGAHWFQWVDQPVTGRFDGEAYNIGLVDVTDIPYTEFIAHIQETHRRLYALHRGSETPYTYPGNRPVAW